MTVHYHGKRDVDNLGRIETAAGMARMAMEHFRVKREHVERGKWVNGMP